MPYTFNPFTGDFDFYQSGGGPGPQGATGATGSPGMDGADAEEAQQGPPGASGAQGPQGSSGAAGAVGQSIPGIDGADGEDGQPIPGAAGATGATGSTGAAGPPSMEWVPDSPDEPMLVPGPTGATGPQGNAGSTGAAGPLIWIQQFDEPQGAEDAMPPAYVSDKNLAYLGKITGTGVTVGPLVWNEVFDRIIFEYQIGGYSGGTPVGRILCGSASITTTGLTNGNGLLEGATVNNTSVSVPGCPLAVTLSSIARSGWGVIRGLSGALKQLDIRGMSGNPAVATAPTVFSARSFFSVLSTNLPIKRLQLTVYDTLIATAVSANTFTATTYIRAWGMRINP